jgi:putative ABC transport system permease protein
MIGTLISTITYVLIGFASISLLVSTIMIGIITYVSVIERTKEIGILRSVGARKKDVSRVFNAETLIIGFVAGMLGVGISYLLIIPINSVIAKLVDINGIADLSVMSAVILVVGSMILTLIAGLIPSRMAAKKDPVVALRTE